MVKKETVSKTTLKTDDQKLYFDEKKRTRLIELFKFWNLHHRIALSINIPALVFLILALLLALWSRDEGNNWSIAWLSAAGAVAFIMFVSVLIFILMTPRIKNEIGKISRFFPESFRQHAFFQRYFEAKSKNEKPMVGFFSTRHIIDFLEAYDPEDDKLNYRPVRKRNQKSKSKTK